MSASIVLAASPARAEGAPIVSTTKSPSLRELTTLNVAAKGPVTTSSAQILRRAEPVAPLTGGTGLLEYSALGAGLALAGGASLSWTGANRDISRVGVPMLVSGLGMVGQSALASLYSLSGGHDARPAAPPPLALSLGYAHVIDPEFAYEHFAVVAARLQLGPVGIEPSIWSALGANNERARVVLSYSLWNDAEAGDLRAELAATSHRFGDDGFTSRALVTSLSGRLNLERLGSAFAGSFSTLRLGYGEEIIDLKMSGANKTESRIVMARAGFGVYLPRGGEAEIHYDHRRDDFAGGLSPSIRRGSGFAGYVGASLRQPISESFTVLGSADLGSAWVISTGLEVSWGRQ